MQQTGMEIAALMRSIRERGYLMDISIDYHIR